MLDWENQEAKDYDDNYGGDQGDYEYDQPGYWEDVTDEEVNF